MSDMKTEILTANNIFLSQSAVTLTGLTTGFQTSDDACAILSSESCLFGSGCVETEHSDPASPMVCISAPIGSGDTIGSIAQTVDTTALFQVPNGTNGKMLGVLVQNFTVLMEKYNFVVSLPNTLTATLAGKYDLAASAVTISVRAGSQTNDMTILSLRSTPNLLGSTTAWTKPSGQQALSIASPMTSAANASSISFLVHKSAYAQSSPTANIVPDIKGGSIIEPIALASKNILATALYGVTSGLSNLAQACSSDLL